MAVIRPKIGGAASDGHLPGQVDVHLLLEVWGQRKGAAMTKA